MLNKDENFGVTMSLEYSATLTLVRPRPSAAHPHICAASLPLTTPVIGHSGVAIPTFSMSEAQTQKDVKMKIDPNELLKTNGIINDILSYANESMKTNDLSEMQINLLKWMR